MVNILAVSPPIFPEQSAFILLSLYSTYVKVSSNAASKNRNLQMIDFCTSTHCIGSFCVIIATLSDSGSVCFEGFISYTFVDSIRVEFAVKTPISIVFGKTWLLPCVGSHYWKSFISPLHFLCQHFRRCHWSCPTNLINILHLNWSYSSWTLHWLHRFRLFFLKGWQENLSIFKFLNSLSYLQFCFDKKFFCAA